MSRSTRRPGWYGAVSWHEADLGQLTLLHYDNRADPAARRKGQIAWQTSFTSLGLGKAYVGKRHP